MPPGFFTPIILNSQFTHNQLLSTNTCPQDNVYIEANFELLNWICKFIAEIIALYIGFLSQ